MKHDFYEILALYINTNMLLSNFEFEHEDFVNTQQDEEQKIDGDQVTRDSLMLLRKYGIMQPDLSST